MAAIAGHDGNVVYGAGYTTNVHAWRLTDSAASLDITPFQPAGDYMQRGVAIGNWEGEYQCWQSATVATTLNQAGGYYTTNAHAYTINMTAEDLLTTPFAVDYNTRITGLLSATGTYDCYMDDTTALPQHGSTDTLTLTVAGGVTYEIPHVIQQVEARVDAAGGDRHVVVSWESSGQITETAVPLIGSTGAAQFIGAGAREYSGTIIVLSVGITQTAQRDSAEWAIGFVGTGDPAAA